ncbi:Mitotic-spindle organizing protein 2A, partial [Trichoplax sp. H2]
MSDQSFLVNEVSVSKATLSASANGNLISGHTIDNELYTLCRLSGCWINKDVFKTILDLLRANVQPNAILQVLKSIVASKLKKTDVSL